MEYWIASAERCVAAAAMAKATAYEEKTSMYNFIIYF